MMAFDQEKGSPILCIDLGKVANKGCADDVDDKEEWLRVGQELTKSFEDIGFAYIKNHGIPQELLEKAEKLGSQFFALPEPIKSKYSKDLTINHGYVHMNREKLGEGTTSTELHESFDMCKMNGIFPTEVDGFRDVYVSLFQELRDLSSRLLRCLEIGLGIPNGTFLTKHMMSSMNATALRILNYPPIGHITKNSMRCGAHSDYGSITLLIQDNIGGLEVMNREGLWVKADPIPNTILINVGDILEAWTNGRFVATKHRVRVPEDEVQKRSVRRSMAYFHYPDNDIVFQHKSVNEGKPITALQYLKKKFSEVY